MPDVTLVVHGLAESRESALLERAVGRLRFVRGVNVDPAKQILAVSYEGGETELGQIEDAVRDAGYEYKPSPGAKSAGG